MTGQNCNEKNRHLFFAPDVESDDVVDETFYYENSEDIDEARILCDTCPVLKWCGKNHWDVPDGVIAGTIPIERGFKNGKRFKKIRNPFL